VNEAMAKLEAKRAEEASGRASLAETYARIRELESKIALALSVKSDEIIKEQQLVLQLNVAKQDASSKSEVINSLLAATRETEIRMAAADAEMHTLGQKLEDLKAQEISKSARIQAKTQQLEDEQLVIAELKKAREIRDGELSKELEAARAEKNSLARRDYDLDDQLKKAKAERDEVEKRCKARGVEIERFLKLKESLSKREPAQIRELERVAAEVAQLQKASDERGARVVALRDSIKSMESGENCSRLYGRDDGGGDDDDGGGGGGGGDNDHDENNLNRGCQARKKRFHLHPTIAKLLLSCRASSRSLKKKKHKP
jgi:chromosome segregation ATPase